MSRQPALRADRAECPDRMHACVRFRSTRNSSQNFSMRRERGRTSETGAGVGNAVSVIENGKGPQSLERGWRAVGETVR